MSKKTTISALVMEYFQRHPNEDLKHGPVVDWVEKQYRKLYRKKPRDTWRAIRHLHQRGLLMKVKKGVYRYDPNFIKEVDLWEFSPAQKKAILERDGYKCTLCGRGVEDGVELCADHVLPKDKGGTNTIDNGRTLCMQCNLMKKNYSQTEAAKKYFVRMYEQAVAKGDQRIIEFCKCVFDCYDKHDVNHHIPRPNHKEESAKK